MTTAVDLEYDPRRRFHQVQRLQWLARRAVRDLLGGAYHSVFKGTGLAFDEVRPYAPGEDVRRIDWNVTARMDEPFLKRFIEERERTVLLVLDASASLCFGTGHLTKRDAAAELAALLTFAALANNDRVGLLLFSDQLELALAPAKGQRHALRVIREILWYTPRRRGTNLRQALDRLPRVVRRRAIVFVLSDFLDSGYEDALRRASARHDLIAVRLSDPREQTLPPVGLVHWRDAETDTPLLIDTTSLINRHAYQIQADEHAQRLRQITQAANIDLVETQTDGDHLNALLRFFRSRLARAKRS
ncbi:MAG: DUF58 domain-containing protein [Gemmataceae bacterium]